MLMYATNAFLLNEGLNRYGPTLVQRRYQKTYPNATRSELRAFQHDKEHANDGLWKKMLVPGLILGTIGAVVGRKFNGKSLGRLGKISMSLAAIVFASIGATLGAAKPALQRQREFVLQHRTMFEKHPELIANHRFLRETLNA